MGAETYIQNNFVGKELCITFGDDAETITYNESWAANMEYFRGVVRAVEHGIIVFDIVGVGTLYVSCYEIKCFWEPEFDYHKAIRTSLTKRLVGARRKD